MGLAHSPRIVTDGLILALDAGNTKSYPGSGNTWTDLSGNSNNATLINGPTYSSSDGGYLDFDGASDYATLPELSLAGNEITFTVWNYGITVQNSSIIYIENSSGNRIMNVHLPWGNSEVTFDKGFGGSSPFYDRIVKSVSNSEYQGWHHWAFTANASTGSMKIYLDSVLWHSGTGKTRTFPDATGSGDRRIGRDGGSNEHRGYVSNLKLYTKELTAAEVQQNYNATKGRYA
jgi:hypothetical protein